MCYTKRIFAMTVIMGISSLCAWEDHPDREDHRDTDRVFRDAQESTGCGRHDRSTLSEQDWGKNDRDHDRAPSEERGTVGPPDRDR
jgi:hypothetical protein